MALYVGNYTRDYDLGKGVRSYVVLRYRPATGYQWSKVFVSDPVAARQRVRMPTVDSDGWLFGYFGGDWLKVLGI